MRQKRDGQKGSRMHREAEQVQKGWEVRAKHGVKGEVRGQEPSTKCKAGLVLWCAEVANWNARACNEAQECRSKA